MEHPYIYWTKVYDLKHEKGNFNIFISYHKSEAYAGTVFYYIFNRETNEPNSEIPAIVLKYEKFFDTTEQGVYDQCENWVKQNLKGTYKIVERKET